MPVCFYDEGRTDTNTNTSKKCNLNRDLCSGRCSVQICFRVFVVAYPSYNEIREWSGSISNYSSFGSSDSVRQVNSH